MAADQEPQNEIRGFSFGTGAFANKEQKNLQQQLSKKLGPNLISQKSVRSDSKKVAFVETWKLISLANELFGFNGWSNSITSQSIDYVDEVDCCYNVGVSACVRVTIKDGTYHEELGYGLSEGLPSKGLSIERARKDAISDALKRCLRNFGNAFGNCLGDKNYLQWVVNEKNNNPIEGSYFEDISSGLISCTEILASKNKEASTVPSGLPDVQSPAFIQLHVPQQTNAAAQVNQPTSRLAQTTPFQQQMPMFALAPGPSTLTSGLAPSASTQPLLFLRPLSSPVNVGQTCAASTLFNSSAVLQPQFLAQRCPTPSTRLNSFQAVNRVPLGSNGLGTSSTIPVVRSNIPVAAISRAGVNTSNTVMSCGVALPPEASSVPNSLTFSTALNPNNFSSPYLNATASSQGHFIPNLISNVDSVRPQHMVTAPSNFFLQSKSEKVLLPSIPNKTNESIRKNSRGRPRKVVTNKDVSIRESNSLLQTTAAPVINSGLQNDGVPTCSTENISTIQKQIAYVPGFGANGFEMGNSDDPSISVPYTDDCNRPVPYVTVHQQTDDEHSETVDDIKEEPIDVGDYTDEINPLMSCETVFNGGLKQINANLDKNALINDSKNDIMFDREVLSRAMTTLHNKSFAQDVEDFDAQMYAFINEMPVCNFDHSFSEDDVASVKSHKRILSPNFVAKQPIKKAKLLLSDYKNKYAGKQSSKRDAEKQRTGSSIVGRRSVTSLKPCKYKPRKVHSLSPRALSALEWGNSVSRNLHGSKVSEGITTHQSRSSLASLPTKLKHNGEVRKYRSIKPKSLLFTCGVQGAKTLQKAQTNFKELHKTEFDTHKAVEEKSVVNNCNVNNGPLKSNNENSKADCSKEDIPVSINSDRLTIEATRFPGIEKMEFDVKQNDDSNLITPSDDHNTCKSSENLFSDVSGQSKDCLVAETTCVQNPSKTKMLNHGNKERVTETCAASCQDPLNAPTSSSLVRSIGAASEDENSFTGFTDDIVLNSPDTQDLSLDQNVHSVEGFVNDFVSANIKLCHGDEKAESQCAPGATDFKLKSKICFNFKKWTSGIDINSKSERKNLSKNFRPRLSMGDMPLRQKVIENIADAQCAEECTVATKFTDETFTRKAGDDLSFMDDCISVGDSSQNTTSRNGLSRFECGSDNVTA